MMQRLNVVIQNFDGLNESMMLLWCLKEARAEKHNEKTLLSQDSCKVKSFNDNDTLKQPTI